MNTTNTTPTELTEEDFRTRFSHDDAAGTVSYRGRVIAAKLTRGWTPTLASSSAMAPAVSGAIWSEGNDCSASQLRRMIAMQAWQRRDIEPID